MADETSSSASPPRPSLSPSPSPPPPPPPFLEVSCKISGKNYRFASGTKAEFAVALINKKLGFVNPRVIYIEAVKEGEEPISFGPHADLVDYERNWMLKTVIDADYPGTDDSDGVSRKIPVQSPSVLRGSDDSKSTRRASKPETKQGTSLFYIGKTLAAFVLMFVVGALFTIALENLPRLILLINSYM